YCCGGGGGCRIVRHTDPIFTLALSILRKASAHAPLRAYPLPHTTGLTQAAVHSQANPDRTEKKTDFFCTVARQPQFGCPSGRIPMKTRFVVPTWSLHRAVHVHNLAVAVCDTLPPPPSPVQPMANSLLSAIYSTPLPFCYVYVNWL
uniref:Secreted protein n=1 Tax=Mesocestoides corti TaxID=53468 RepID=A0A5K3FZV2_MESCO